MRSATEGRRRQVGSVLARILITNETDLTNSTNGLIPSDAVRRVELDGVLVDTGATLLSLPKEMLDALGLRFSREVAVETATGTAIARMFTGALLSVEGRETSVPVLELPGGSQPLLGVTPLAILGIELDLRHQRLVLLPDQDSRT